MNHCEILDNALELDLTEALKYLKAAGLGISFLTVGAYAYLSNPKNFEVEVTHITIPMRYLAPQFNGFTIAHITDLHMGMWLTPERMLDIAEQVNNLQPDVIAITGDFVTEIWHSSPAELTRSLNTLRAKEIIVGVFGNHDHHTNTPGQIGEAIEKANITMLINASVPIRRGDATLYLAGVDDIWVKQNDLARALADIPPESPIVLLAHEPDYADEAALSHRIGLQLSGHTHGGQVRLPGIGAPVLPSLGKKYDQGLYQINGMALYVNRGLGMIPPFIRINCRPEITQITLVAR